MSAHQDFKPIVAHALQCMAMNRPHRFQRSPIARFR